jgi:hypothetical protein
MLGSFMKIGTGKPMLFLTPQMFFDVTFCSDTPFLYVSVLVVVFCGGEEL